MTKSILEEKAVQEPMIKYAHQIGWEILDAEEAENQRNGITGLFLNSTLRDRIHRLNPGIQSDEEVDSVIRQFQLLKPTIEGNKDFLEFIRGERTYFDQEEQRERNLTLIDFEHPENNFYQVVKELVYSNGTYKNRADVIFFINGIPVIIVENKNAKDECGFEKGLTQVIRYSHETPELLLPAQLFVLNEGLKLFYGGTWSFSVKNIFVWKSKQEQFEDTVKGLFAISNVLEFLKDFIIFSYRDDNLVKMVLRQHQTRAVKKVVERAGDKDKRTALIWHTQGSGKTLTMITTALKLMLLKIFDKPTVILLLDRNELEDQMAKNLEAVGLKDVVKVRNRKHFRELLSSDYRGIILSMIHKFDKMPADINNRRNLFVLIDEAHRTTSSDLGSYMLAALPNATFFGFTGTPIDRISYGKGTFKVFGKDDEQGYLDKYSIAESIKDKTTLPLNYALAPNEFRVPKEFLEKEFLNLADAEAVTDIEQLDKILARAVNTKNFLKSHDRIDKIARFVATHFTDNVEPMGYKAFLVGVDRESCGLYKEALDKYLPSEYSQVVYTSAHNDSQFLKKYHLDEDEEKKIRKEFPIAQIQPKILIVTEKLLTGFDAPCLYVMYMDKPMRDHTLLQAIARVNRPYEDKEGIKKPYGLIVDFVGILDKLEKALAFDSDVVASVIQDIEKLKERFEKLITQDAKEYLDLLGEGFADDKALEEFLSYIIQGNKRLEFKNLYKELETLYEVISPDPFLRPYIDDFTYLSQAYGFLNTQFNPTVKIDKDFQNKTAQLVRQNVSTKLITDKLEIFEINENTLAKLKESKASEPIKVINLIKSTRKYVDENKKKQKYLISIAERLDKVQATLQSQQLSTKQTLKELEEIIEQINQYNQQLVEKGFDDQTFFIFTLLSERFGEYQLNNDEVAKKLMVIFDRYKFWQVNSEDKRQLKAEIYKSFFNPHDTILQIQDSALSVDEITQFVERLFEVLEDV